MVQSDRVAARAPFEEVLVQPNTADGIMIACQTPPITQTISSPTKGGGGYAGGNCCVKITREHCARNFPLFFKDCPRQLFLWATMAAAPVPLEHPNQPVPQLSTLHLVCLCMARRLEPPERNLCNNDRIRQIKKRWACGLQWSAELAM
uniref:Uncharacterized protein n=1 Tax=Eutreptiella gymnastica TaxID=73025 RepID=A0A7S1JET6_9EUGL